MDFLGIGARARVKALEQALEIERARTADLTRQLIAMADTKAFKVLHPNEVTKGPKVTTERAVQMTPTEIPDHNAYVRKVRDQMPKRVM